MSTSIKVNCRSLFLSPFCLEYNDSLFLYFLYNNRLQLLEKFVLVYLPFLFNFGPTFFWKKCLIFVTLGTVDVLDVNASVVCKAVCVCQSFFFSFIQYQYWILGFAAGRLYLQGRRPIHWWDADGGIVEHKHFFNPNKKKENGVA